MGLVNCCERKMPEIHLGTHTIRSHGVKVARLHMHDWLILVLLVVIEVVLNIINPFYRFVGESMMADLRYPLQDNTVPFWAVPVIAILLPFAIFLVYYLFRRDVYDLHQAILGLLFSVLITGVITDAIKDAVGRPRPDFFWRCFPDGKPEYDSSTRGVICHGDRSVIKEGHKNFPSGHTSWSFTGLGFIAWYMAGKIRVFDRRDHVAKLCILFLPLLAAALVGISRVDDYWHHWQDVFAGGFLVYKMQQDVKLALPEIYQGDNLLDFDHYTGWGPHALFQMLEETRNDNQQSSEVNRLQMQGTELREIYIPSEDCLDTSVVATRDNIPMINVFGAGRRS